MSEEKTGSGIELDKLDLSSLMKPKEPPEKMDEKTEEEPSEASESPDAEADEKTEVVLLDSDAGTSVGTFESGKSMSKLVIPVILGIITGVSLSLYISVFNGLL